jgi:hypothetical protein
MAPTRADAFTRVERTTSDKAAQPVVMNFIVQLDTAVFPAEVKQRLTSYRALASTAQELETGSIMSDRAISEAVRVLDVGVVEALLQDRGQPTDVDRLRAMRGRAARTQPGGWPPGAYLVVREGGLVAWKHGTRQYLSDGVGEFQTVWNAGFVDTRRFSEGNSSWAISQHMATVGARGWH